MWFAQALAEGYENVAIRKPDNRYFAVQWAWQDRSIYFAFESGDHHARWGAIARESIGLAGSARRFGAVVFRTPDLTPIPRPTWGAAKIQIEDAEMKGLRIVPLSLDEVCELHAARELYSNALQRSPSEGRPPAVRIEAQPDTSPQRSLTEAQLRTVLDIVSQRMLVDINEVLRSLGDESLKAAVLRAIEGNRNVKAHPGPQTIYLQWRIAA